MGTSSPVPNCVGPPRERALSQLQPVVYLGSDASRDLNEFLSAS